jgi:hypothetical protein
VVGDIRGASFSASRRFIVCIRHGVSPWPMAGVIKCLLAVAFTLLS